MALLGSSPRQALAEGNVGDVSVQPSSVSSAPEQSAAKLFEQAEALYLEGDVQGALEKMLRAYEISGKPELLFNLGQLRQELQQCRLALADYRVYLARVPGGAYRGDAVAAVAALERDCPDSRLLVAKSTQVSSSAAPSATKAMPQRASSEREPYWKNARILGWSALGVSAAAGAAALFFALDAASIEDDLESRVREIRAQRGSWTSADEAQEASGQQAAMWGRVLGISAGAAGISGLVLLLLSQTPTASNEHGRSTVSVNISEGEFRAGYGAKF